MAAPSLSIDGKWLICAIRLGQGVQPQLPGLLDDTTVLAVSVDHIVLVTDYICQDQAGERIRGGVNMLLQTGSWITVQGQRAAVATLLGIV